MTLRVGQVYRDQYGGEWYIYARRVVGRVDAGYGGGRVKFSGVLVTPHPDLSSRALIGLTRGYGASFLPAGDQTGGTMPHYHRDGDWPAYVSLLLTSSRAATEAERRISMGASADRPRLGTTGAGQRP